ncbi:MAG: DUF488 domain-containing protein [Paludibacteraceae bacterium]|jgi:uncharacterized protein (DUF488 family)|nr:DUF488 domain-containing protein [Paludibacteraceae bacterium]HOD62468.1 DUF488 domain-containing protein [Bacilli bacterium]
MYYRRKILLGLLEAFDNRLEKIQLQKLLMLVTKQQQKPDFHFVPYKYGCYSFQANSDLGTMAKYNQVILQGNEWVKIDNEKYLLSLKERDRQAIKLIKQLYGAKTSNELIRITYIKYPYLAINSTVAKDKLSSDEFDKVLQAKPKSDKTILFTIGYEGLSLEEYLNKLILSDIKVLCDVRRNPLSMKFGFSKSQLQKACQGVGIEYVHIPELGIESDKRQVLNTQSDYDKLFSLYRSEMLTQTLDYQLKLITLLKEKKRIALTCFEANINQCHRKHLADAIVNLSDFNYELKHI